jgi:L-amino acid N-acyltransferase YncA
MMNSPITLARAAPADIAGILDLQERNLLANGGMLSVRWSREWFEQAVADMPIIVAREAASVVGYVVSTPLSVQTGSPIIQAMLCAYSGPPGTYNYGPICVAGTHRQRGLAVAMFQELRRQLPDRQGITFIRSDNTVSRTAHTRMGMREVAQFTQGGVAYVVVAYDG